MALTSSRKDETRTSILDRRPLPVPGVDEVQLSPVFSTSYLKLRQDHPGASMISRVSGGYRGYIEV